MGNVPGNAKMPWIQEYRNPEPGPNRPGKDGSSVSSTMGNCPRCGNRVHHEKHGQHNLKKHMGM